jgi:hypothetical protein
MKNTLLSLAIGFGIMLLTFALRDYLHRNDRPKPMPAAAVKVDCPCGPDCDCKDCDCGSRKIGVATFVKD